MFTAQVSGITKTRKATFIDSLQSTLLLGSTNGVSQGNGRNKPMIIGHKEMESYLGRYAGLMLYLKEMDENVYAKLCAVRFIVI